MNEWIKRFLLGVFLILLAGGVFYLVAPKWTMTTGSDGSVGYKINTITGTTYFCAGTKCHNVTMP